MKSRKKKTLPVRAKRYNKKKSENFGYDNLEPRQLLAADFLSAVNYVGSDQIRLTEPVAVTEGVEILRHQLELGNNESLKLQNSTTDRLGQQHLKYQQYYNDILVEGSAYTLHVQDSQIIGMSGNQVEIVSPVDQISLTSEQAHQSAMDHIGATAYAWQDEFTSELLGFDGAPEGELVYITDTNTGSSVPTYKFDMWAIDLGTRDYVYINANTGVVELVSSRIRGVDVAATGQSHYNGIVEFTADQVSDNEFRLRQITDGVETYDNQMNPIGDFSDFIDITASSPFFDSPEALSGVSAHWGAEKTLEMFKDWFGRDSYDNVGSTLVSFVNVSESLNNAFWNGSVMQYGEGDGVNFDPLVEIDIVGHEITHGVTEFSAGLIYQNEMGALNESFSDIFGEVVEYYATGTNDWLLGEQSFLGPGGLRSFLNPNDGNQPDTYLGDLWFTGTGDDGGVHFNSGVQNKWFHILSEGEAGTNDNEEDYDVAGIGIEDAAQIAYRNLTVYLNDISQYQDARDGAVLAAIDLFGEKSPQHLQTSAAWAAVGLYSSDISIDSFDEVVPGSRIFLADAQGDVPPRESRGVLMELDADQVISIVVDGKTVPLDFEIEDPSGNVIATSSNGPGNRTYVNAIPAAEAGEYRINVGTNFAVDDFDIRVVLNASIEQEGITGLSNGLGSDAEEIGRSSIPLLSGDLVSVLGEFDISEIPAFGGDDFESGELDGSWTTSSTDGGGRVQVSDLFGAGEGQFALYMDTTSSGFDNLNEAIWTIDLSTVDSPFLNFYHASFDDENTELPESFNGTINGDGVSVSADGETWHTILTDSVTEAGEWHQFTINLQEVATNAGIELTSDFQIKFQQFDDDRLGSDGRAFDGISVTQDSQSEDWYEVVLEPGTTSTFAVAKTFASGHVNLELYDHNFALVATGTPGEGIDSKISQFTPTASDTYFARLVGSATPYGFVVTRGADFDTGSSADAPQDITDAMSVAGYVNTTTIGVSDPDAAADGTVLDNFFEGVTLSNNVTLGSVYGVEASFEAPTGIRVFAPSTSEASGWAEDVNELRADFDIPQTMVSITVGSEESAEDVGFLRAYNSLGEQIDQAISRPLEPGEKQVISVFSPSREIAFILAGGFQNDVTPLDRLTYEIAQEASDFYSIDVAEKTNININASFPGTGEFLFENNLVLPNGDILFRMELIDPSGNVVATGQDFMTFFATESGTYVVRASAVAGDGDYDLMVDAEVQEDRFDLGDLGFGVAVDDAATGKGYLMYTHESVTTRFAASPTAENNADHVVAVRYDHVGQSWQYNNDSAWVDFTPAAFDRLLAQVDFDSGVAGSLEGRSGLVYGIQQGFETSDVDFAGNLWNGATDDGEFEVTGFSFKTGDQVINVGPQQSGIASDDTYRGEGYMMFSEQNLRERFPDNPHYKVASQNITTVRFNSGSWEYHNNVGWYSFVPVEGDRLLAHIDFDFDVITNLEGRNGLIEGIEQGYISSDIEFIANQWNGRYNGGEFGYTGSVFRVSGSATTDLGDLGHGIAVHDDATGQGYIMYSQEDVMVRFAADQPNADNARHLIAVRLIGNSSWEYSNDSNWVAFTPAPSDRLIGEAFFAFDFVRSLETQSGGAVGVGDARIPIGFADSNIQFFGGQFNGGTDSGEFQVTGSYFSVASNSASIGAVNNGITVDDGATGTGFLLYSEEILRDRFRSNRPSGGDAANVFAVRFNTGTNTWQYSLDPNWIDFTPRASDRLIASLDFDADSVSSLQDVEGNFEGISVGFHDGDLTFAADSYRNGYNNGEFQVFGTSFTS